MLGRAEFVVPGAWRRRRCSIPARYQMPAGFQSLCFDWRPRRKLRPAGWGTSSPACGAAGRRDFSGPALSVNSEPVVVRAAIRVCRDRSPGPSGVGPPFVARRDLVGRARPRARGSCAPARWLASPTCNSSVSTQRRRGQAVPVGHGFVVLGRFVGAAVLQADAARSCRTASGRRAGSGRPTRFCLRRSLPPSRSGRRRGGRRRAASCSSRPSSRRRRPIPRCRCPGPAASGCRRRRSAGRLRACSSTALCEKMNEVPTKLAGPVAAAFRFLRVSSRTRSLPNAGFG